MTQVRHRTKLRLPPAMKPLAKDQLAVSRQLLLHLFVHLLIRDTGPAHLVLVVDQNLPHFLVEPVLHRYLFQHPQSDAVGYGSGNLGFDVPALHQTFHNLVGYVRYKVPYEKHLRAVPLTECKSVSLLAASIKCKETREITQKFLVLLRNFILREPWRCRIGSANPVNWTRFSRMRTAACGGPLTPPSASCTINLPGALSSPVSPFGLHPQRCPSNSDSAHHCNDSPTSKPLVQSDRAPPCHASTTIEPP